MRMIHNQQIALSSQHMNWAIRKMKRPLDVPIKKITTATTICLIFSKSHFAKCQHTQKKKNNENNNNNNNSNGRALLLVSIYFCYFVFLRTFLHPGNLRHRCWQKSPAWLFFVHHPVGPPHFCGRWMTFSPPARNLTSVYGLLMQFRSIKNW